MSTEAPAVKEERLMVSVDAEALGDLLHALMGPGYRIRELLVIHELDEKGLSTKPGPIKLLVDQFNEFVKNRTANSVTEADINGN